MYTQCPQCGSVFRVTAATLRIAAGLVRCGVCHHGFDALAALTDEETAPPSTALTAEELAAAPAPDDTITVEELGTGEVIELGAANDDLLADAAPAATPGEAPAAEDDEAGIIDVTDSSVIGVEAITLSSEDEVPGSAVEAPAEAPAEAAGCDALAVVAGGASIESTPVEAPADVVTGTESTEIAAVAPEPALAAVLPETADHPGTGESCTAVEARPVDGLVAAVAPTEAAEAPPQAQEPAGSGPAEPSPEALEFTGSEEDLERVFVAAHQPPLPARGWAVPAPRLGAAAARPDAAVEESTLATAIAALESSEAEDAVGLPATDDAQVITDVRSDASWRLGPESGTATGTEARAEVPAEPSRYADLDATDEYPVLVLDETDTPDAATAQRFGIEFEVPDTAAVPDAETTPGVDAASREAAAGAALAAIPIPEGLRHTLQARAAQEEDFATPAFTLDVPRWWDRSRVWAAAAVLALLTLIAQAVHYHREMLARHAVAGPWLMRTYSLLGLETPVPSDLAAIELHQWGASSDPTRPGHLRLRASLLNHAAFAQPYPVLRVTLHDRFGNAVGSRDIGARDYLPGGAPEHRLLLAGQRLDAEITLVDPGSDAVGYEIELCREDRDGVRCRGTTPPST